MIIAVVSDTHRFHQPMQQVIRQLEGVDMLIHLGDVVEDVEYLTSKFSGKILNVRGNCDPGSFIAKEKVEVIEGKKFFITHGDRYNVKSSLMNLKYRAQEIGAEVVLFGHTHIALVEYEQGVWFINPGSPSIGIDRKNSFALIEINEGKVNPSIHTI